MENQEFGLANSYISSEDQRNPYDGIFGMGMQAQEPTTPTLLENMKNQGLINEIIFALFLRKDYLTGNGSKVFLGDIDHSYCTDAFHKVPLSDPTYYWQITSHHISLAHTVLTNGNNTQAILDTGSPYISKFQQYENDIQSSYI